MTDLAAFLLARIGEDEEVARATEHVDGPETLEWRRGGKRNLWFDNGRGESYESVFAGSWDRILVARDDGSVTTHIARHDPARVLADCEARRRIVGLHDDDWHECPDQAGVGDWRGTGKYDCPTLRLLALPYAGHPDYREEWKCS